MAGRISFSTAGSMVLLVSAVTSLCGPVVLAGDVTISDERKTTVTTATGDGNGPGNVTIDTNGIAGVTSGTAVILNSNNTITNNGQIQNAGATNAVGILVDLSQDRTGSILNNGYLLVPGPSDLLSKTVSNNVGILLSGPGTFTGDITLTSLTSGAFTVGGDTSFGVLSQSHIVGKIENDGIITNIGLDSYGIATTGLVTGNITNLGAINAVGGNSVGLYIGGGVTGTVLNGGTIGSGTGPQLVPDKTGTRLVTSEAVNGRAGVWIASSINGGFKNDGNGLTILQQNADATAAAAATPADAFIAVIGSAPAINITPGGLAAPQSFIVSPTATEGYGFVNKGVITASGATTGVNALGFNIEGLSSGGTNYTARVEGFINAGGDIQVQAEDGTSTAFHIGNYGTVTNFVNTGDITAATQDSTLNATTGAVGTKGGTAYGIVVDALGRLNTFNNSGHLTVAAQGINSSAYGVIDKSGTLTSFTNSGGITLSLPLGSTQVMRAVDLSANTTGVAFTNTGSITGDVLLGGGASTFNSSNAGTIFGNVTFQAGASKTGSATVTMNAATITGILGLGNGTNILNLSNNAAISGGLTQSSGGILTLNVDHSSVTVTDKQILNTNSATFSTGSKLTFLVSGAGPNTVMSGGAIRFDAGSQITVAYDGILTSSKTIAVINANALTFGAPLSQILVQPTSFLNVATFALDPANANRLLLSVHAKTATELNLGQNMTALYGAFATALNKDSAIAAAVSNQATEAATKAAFQKLLPDTSGATLQAALDNNEMANGMIRRRLTAVAKNGIPDHTLGEVAGFWMQALGDYEDQHAKGEQAGFDLWGLGIALGFDIPIEDHTILGLSVNESWHSANLQINKNSPTQFYATQVDLYAHTQWDQFYIQAIGGGTFNSYEQTRRVVFDTTVSRVADSKWKGYQMSGALEFGYGIYLDKFKLTPYARGSYAKVHENGYSETGGGDGINLNVSEKNPDSMRGSLGFNLDRNFPIFYDSYVEAEFRGDFTREFQTDPFAVTASFVAGGPAFTNFSNTPNKNTFGAGFGVSHKDSYSSVSLDYDARISSGFLSHTASVTVRFRF